MEEASDRPKWLLELESRKRKCRLAHEAGAGAPCIVCGSTCPGLDLHFWRKICKNCKCSRDDHDVDDDEFPQFDVLFGPSSKSKNRIMLLPVRNNKNKHMGESAFEWVPPNTTKELAADYMKALPAERLPIKGSSGAALRKQQLQKQLPLHDVDHKVCDALSEEEQKQFQRYLAELKRYVGQGTVTKALSARPSDHLLMTPASAADMQQFSPQHKLQNSVNQAPQLRTPSSFNPKMSYPSLTSHRHQTPIPYDQQSNPREYKCLSTNTRKSDIARSEPVSGTAEKLSEDLGGPGLTDEESTSSTNPRKFCQVHQHPQCCDDKCKYAVQMADSTPLKHVKEHFGCSPTRGTLEQLILNSPQYSTGLQKGSAANDSSNTAKDDENEKLNAENALIAESILADALLPPSAIHNNDIIGSTLDQDKLKFIREKLANKYGAQEEVLGNISDTCTELKANDSMRKADTKKTTVPSSLRVSVENPLTKDLYDPRINEKSTLSNNPPLNEIQHNGEKYAPPTIISPSKQDATSNNANCLQAKLCNDFRPPINIIHSENLQTQVFPHEMTNASDQTPHNLPSIEKIREGLEGLTLKLPKAKRCNKCQEDIKVDDVIVTVEKAENIAWHPGCFVCSICNELLADLVYFYYKNKLYCGRDLASHLGIPRCFACDELIFVREYTVAEGHNYHVKHFCCWDCDVPLAGRQYVSENDRPLCLPCYESKYANTCDACKTTIAADQKGVAIKNLNFHANDACFCCVTCKKGLLNGRIAVREGKLYCSRECFT